jgi:hypothetical protein
MSILALLVCTVAAPSAHADFLYVSDYGNGGTGTGSIDKVPPSGGVTALATGFDPISLSFSPNRLVQEVNHGIRTR